MPIPGSQTVRNLEFMWERVDRLGVIVLDAGLASTVLLAVVTLAMVVSRQPARRVRLARAAMAGSLALIPLIGLGLVPRFDIVEFLRSLGLFLHPALSTWTDSLQRFVSVFSRFGPWPSRLITLFYLSGLAAGFAWLILGFFAVFLLRRASERPSAEALGLLESLPFAPLVRRPRLRVSRRSRRPMLVGTIWPMILIPPELDVPGPVGLSRLKLSLLHELAHAESADAWFGLLGNLVRAFWFFVPPLWWIRSQVRLDQEFLADRRAAISFGPMRDYASSLLELASSPDANFSSTPMISVREKSMTSPLFRRVMMLLRCPFPVEVKPPNWWSYGVPCLVVLLTLASSTLAFRPPRFAPVPPAKIHQFAMGTLELPPAFPNIHGRVPLFELPLRLPERFDLTLEVWGNLATLAKMRISGLPLDSPLRIAISKTFPDPETWHTVQLRGDNGTFSLRIDDVPVEFLNLPGQDSSVLTPWLSVEQAPDLPGLFQNLVLTW